MMTQSVRNRVLELLQALAHENRLKILGLVAAREYSVMELAAALELREPTISHHLTKLHDAGVVRMRPEGTTHYYALNVEALHELNRRLQTKDRVASISRDVKAGAAGRKVLASFLDGETLLEIPASRKKRDVVLDWLAGKFEPGREYPEREVNAILKRHHEDTATLRRELVGGRWLQRDRGVYWKLEPASA
jgi:predicted transcriptional regulator